MKTIAASLMIAGFVAGFFLTIIAEPFFSKVAVADTGDGDAPTVCDGGNFRVYVKPSYAAPRLVWECADRSLDHIFTMHQGNQ